MGHKELCLCSEWADDPFLVYEMLDEVKFFDPTIDYGALLVKNGVFSSISKAWDNGYKGSIPDGWLNFRYQDFDIYIYNPSNSWERQDGYLTTSTFSV